MFIIIFIFDAPYLEADFSSVTDKQKEKMAKRECDKYESGLL